MAVGEAAGRARATRRASLRSASRPALQTTNNCGGTPVSTTGSNNPHSEPRRSTFSDSNSNSNSSSTSFSDIQDHNSDKGQRFTVQPRCQDEGLNDASALVDSAHKISDRVERSLSRRKSKVNPRKPEAIPSAERVAQRRPARRPESPTPLGHVALGGPEQSNVMSRPRTGRAGTGRDTRDGDVETEVLNRVIEAVKKAKEHNDNCQRIGSQIIALEADIKTKGSSTPEQHRKLDALYRDMMRNAEQEKRVHDDEDIVSNLAIIASLKTNDEPSLRGGHAPKSRKVHRPILESDVIADSPGPSPSDTRLDIIKRGKGTAQRSSSVASQGRSGTVLKDDTSDTNRGIQAEKTGQLIVGAEVFYRRSPKGSPDDLGVGIQCIIKKVWQDKKPIQYEVMDPEPDPNGKPNLHKAYARDLIPIPPPGASLPTFSIGANVYARYPDTDTFYHAKVRGIQKGEYTLRFEGEEDDKEQPVEKRFVLDTKMR